MTGHDDKLALIETVLVHVRDDRRRFLRHLLTAAGAAFAIPLTTSTAVAYWAEDECFYYERKVKKGKYPGEYRVEVKKKKCPPDEAWFEGKHKKGKRFEEWAKPKGKKGWRWIPDDDPY